MNDRFIPVAVDIIGNKKYFAFLLVPFGNRKVFFLTQDQYILLLRFVLCVHISTKWATNTIEVSR